MSNSRVIKVRSSYLHEVVPTNESYKFRNLPLVNSLYHAWTIALACFLWWISHRESVWTLCWVLERSANFFSNVAVEKEVIFQDPFQDLFKHLHENTGTRKQQERRNWARNHLDLVQKPLLWWAHDSHWACFLCIYR